MHYFRVVAVLAIGFVAKYIDANCIHRPNKESELKEPVFLHNETSFLFPKIGGVLSLKSGERVLIACPNKKNFLVNNNRNVSVGVCTNGKIKVENGIYDLEALQCSKSLRGDIKKTNKKCGNNEGYLTGIGYYVSRTGFLPLIEICYDGDKGSTLYSKHTIYGASIRNASKSSARPSFSTQGLNVSASVAYKRPYLKATFTKLLGSALLAENYVNDKSYLSRGHLSPDADFLFAPWQFATYFYINVCPQWQTINAGNWHKVEATIRKVAGNLEDNLQVVTGTYGVLKLRDVGGRLRDMYLLPGDKLPIPEYIWKVVHSARSREAVVIVILNNPFAKNVTQSSYLCPRSICQDNGWYDDNWSKSDKGIVHCCEYKEFRKTVRTVPILSVKSILKGPKRH